MDTDTRNKVIHELTIYLGREPLEREIMNAQSDHLIMSRVRDKKDQELREEIAKIKVKSDKIDQIQTDVASLKIQIK